MAKQEAVQRYMNDLQSSRASSRQSMAREDAGGLGLGLSLGVDPRMADLASFGDMSQDVSHVSLVSASQSRACSRVGPAEAALLSHAHDAHAAEGEELSPPSPIAALPMSPPASVTESHEAAAAARPLAAVVGGLAGGGHGRGSTQVEHALEVEQAGANGVQEEEGRARVLVEVEAGAKAGGGGGGAADAGEEQVGEEQEEGHRRVEGELRAERDLSAEILEQTHTEATVRAHTSHSHPSQTSHTATHTPGGGDDFVKPTPPPSRPTSARGGGAALRPTSALRLPPSASAGSNPGSRANSPTPKLVQNTQNERPPIATATSVS
jgi:hypothetical protein